MSVALIAGEGALPEEIARRMSAGGEKPVIYAMREDTDSFLPYASALLPVYKTELAATLADMASRGVRKVMFAGLVPKTLMYRPELLDDMAGSLVDG
ncbi:MAG: LpxI family protein, partial [Synergistaceae bacterium]|nr:LpxI family protein [Synergistaceae bacterium]